MKKLKTNILRYLAVGLFLVVAASFINVNSSQAALKRNGASCQKGVECVSTFCGEYYTCEGTVREGVDCSITDESQSCQSGLYCHGDSLKCEVSAYVPSNTAASTTASTSNPGAASATAAATGCSSNEFCNPLNFNTVDSFLSNIMGALQKIIVSLSLLMIVIGAVLYVVSGGGKQLETAKEMIVAALVGLAIGIAAPSMLKEIAGILDWGVTDTRLAAALSLSEIATKVLNFLLGSLGIISLIMMVIGAFMYLTSAGDEGRIDTGKNIFKYALLGVIIAMSSMVMVTQIARFFTNS